MCLDGLCQLIHIKPSLTRAAIFRRLLDDKFSSEVTMLKTSSCRTHRVLRRHSLCGSFLGSRLARSKRVAVTGHRRRADRTSPDPNEHCRRSSPGDAARLLWVRRVRPLWLWVRDEPAVELLCVHIRNILAVKLLRIRIRIVPAVELLRIRIRIVPAVELLRVGIWIIPAVELLRVPKQGVYRPYRSLYAYAPYYRRSYSY